MKVSGMKNQLVMFNMFTYTVKALSDAEQNGCGTRKPIACIIQVNFC